MTIEIYALSAFLAIAQIDYENGNDDSSKYLNNKYVDDINFEHNLGELVPYNKFVNVKSYLQENNFAMNKKYSKIVRQKLENIYGSISTETIDKQIFNNSKLEPALQVMNIDDASDNEDNEDSDSDEDSIVEISQIGSIMEETQDNTIDNTIGNTNGNNSEISHVFQQIDTLKQKRILTDKFLEQTFSYK